MRILYSKDNIVDFEAPIHMTEEQITKFKSGMKKIFNDKISFSEINEKIKEMGDIDRHPKTFTKEDLLLLSNSELDNDKIANILKKTPFAIQMKRGTVLMQLQDWAKKKNIFKPTEKDVEKFIEEVFGK